MPEKIDPNEFLQVEYEYIAQTAFQANEDRARATSFYIVTFGSFIAALVTYSLDSNFAPEPLMRWGFMGLFLVLTVMAVLTILQLVRLRKSWFESILAMNQIKEYYIQKFPDLENVILWRTKSVSMPDRIKLKSVGFLMILQVAVLGSLSFGACLFFGLLAYTGENWVLTSILGVLVAMFLQIDLYRSEMK